ncbi:unnamed protein product [Amoebophrya sp. A120]|nr:unnamed protein product [Amoebophrya sp. A120]|eukprot:GSA120T00013526001.1
MIKLKRKVKRAALAGGIIKNKMTRFAAFLLQLQLLQLLTGGHAVIVFGSTSSINRRPFFLASSPQSAVASLSFAATLTRPFSFFQFASARALAREHSEFASSDDEFLYYEDDGEEGADEAPFADDHENDVGDHAFAEGTAKREKPLYCKVLS